MNRPLRRSWRISGAYFLAAEIMENTMAALAQFSLIAGDLASAKG